jgi:cation transport ATPase
VALFRRSSDDLSEPERLDLETDVRPVSRKKDGPTPTRREAEAARRQRVTRTLTKKQARAEAAREARTRRLKSMNARDNTPEKALLRDYVDARFSFGELLLPSLVVILLTTFAGAAFPRITVIATLVMYLFITLVILDGFFFMWRGYKRVLAERLPNASTRGLMMYGVNRCIQIRRFRMPPPRIKRGDAY